jgi:predicted ATPase
MKRFILTGAPGSGKTSILRVLAATGYPVVDEAATDVNLARLAAGDTEPWTDPMFTERIALLQRHRREEPVSPGTTAQVHDRSAVCTLALARHLGHPVAPVLEAEVARITEAGYFSHRVFFVRPLGFLQPTPERRIRYEESLAFERIHETEYLRFGFEIVEVPAGPVTERAAAIDAHIRSWDDRPPPGRA